MKKFILFLFNYVFFIFYGTASKYIADYSIYVHLFYYFFNDRTITIREYVFIEFVLTNFNV